MIRFAVDFERHAPGWTRKWKFMKYLRSKTRQDVSGYNNYIRVMWLRWDLTFQWLKGKNKEKRYVGSKNNRHSRKDRIMVQT